MSEYIIGKNAVLEYLKNQRDYEHLYLQNMDNRAFNEIISLAKKKGIAMEEVGRKRLSDMTHNGNHQGVVLRVGDFKYSSLEEIVESARKSDLDPLLIILDEITDPHNLGAIIRTAEAAGAHGVIIPKRRSAEVNQTVHKTSAGATSHMKVCKVTNINQTIMKLKDLGYWIYGADGYADSLYNHQNYSGPVGLVIGSEGSGISHQTKKHCDVLVRIPMYGKTESLNASTSAAILIYEVLRYRDANS